MDIFGPSLDRATRKGLSRELDSRLDFVPAQLLFVSSYQDKVAMKPHCRYFYIKLRHPGVDESSETHELALVPWILCSARYESASFSLYRVPGVLSTIAHVSTAARFL